MIYLTPLEETVTGRQLLAQGEARGEARGRALGVLTGQIQLLQEMRGLPVSPDEELAKQSREELEATLLALFSALGLDPRLAILPPKAPAP